MQRVLAWLGWLKNNQQDEDAEQQRQADIQNSQVSEEQQIQSNVNNYDLNLIGDQNNNQENQQNQEIDAPIITDEELIQMLKEVRNELLKDKKKEHFRSKLKSKLSERFSVAEEPRYFYRYVCRNSKERKKRERIDIDEYFEEDAKSIYFQNLVSKIVESSLWDQDIINQEMLA